jgi:hypothetical protein
MKKIIWVRRQLQSMPIWHSQRIDTFSRFRQDKGTVDAVSRKPFNVPGTKITPVENDERKSDYYKYTGLFHP